MTTFNLTLPEIDKKNELPEEVTEEDILDKKDNDTAEEKKTIPELSSNVTAEDKQEELRKKKVVVMDGPLSKIYTEALNIVYNKDPRTLISKESSAIDMTLATNYNSSNTGDDVPERALYVYVLDESNLNNNPKKNFSNISKLMKKHENTDIYVSVESSNVLDNETVNFINFCVDKGCKVYTDRRTCLDAIREYLQ